MSIRKLSPTASLHTGVKEKCLPLDGFELQHIYGPVRCVVIVSTDYANVVCYQAIVILILSWGISVVYIVN
jgi:hypothetical protein